MINIIDTLLSIVDSFFSITMFILPFLMMKNYNLIIITREYGSNVVIRTNRMTIYISNQVLIN